MPVLIYDERKEKFVEDKIRCEKCGEYYSPFMETFSSLRHKCKPKHKKCLSTVQTGKF